MSLITSTASPVTPTLPLHSPVFRSLPQAAESARLRVEPKLDAAKVDAAFAQAQGANFQGAHLQGAALAAARLQGADFTDADLTAADFGAAIIWETKPPASANAAFADFSAIAIKSPEAKDIAALKDLSKSVSQSKVGAKLAALIERVASPDEGTSWNAGEEATGWVVFKQAALTGDSAAWRDRTATFLGKLSCAAEYSDGAVALGIIRRTVDAAQKFDPAILLKRLRAADCPAFKRLPEQALFDLQAAVEKVTPAASVAQDSGAAPQANDVTTTAATAAQSQ